MRVALERDVSDFIERPFLDDEYDVSLAPDGDAVIQKSPFVIKSSQLFYIFCDFLLGIVNRPEQPAPGLGLDGFFKIACLNGLVALELHGFNLHPQALENGVDDFAFGQLLSIQRHFNIWETFFSVKFCDDSSAGLSQNRIDVVAHFEVQLLPQSLVFVFAIILKFD